MVDPKTIKVTQGEESEAEKKRRIARENMPPPGAMLNLDDFERVAKSILSDQAWAYYSSAGDDETSKFLREARRVDEAVCSRTALFPFFSAEGEPQCLGQGMVQAKSAAQDLAGRHQLQACRGLDTCDPTSVHLPCCDVQARPPRRRAQPDEGSWRSWRSPRSESNSRSGHLPREVVMC